MSGVTPSESVHVRDFNSMRDCLIGAGAGDCALAGTVVDLDRRVAFNATYFVDTEHQPPIIAQFIEDRGLVALVRIAVTADGQPLASLTRHRQTSEPPESLLTPNLPQLRSDRLAGRVFEYMYANVVSFEPNTAG